MKDRCRPAAVGNGPMSIDSRSQVTSASQSGPATPTVTGRACGADDTPTEKP
jgi:hypothetical protein